MKKHFFILCITTFILSCSSEESTQPDSELPEISNENQIFNITIEVQGEGTVSEEAINSANGPIYIKGTRVKLTAIPSEGWVFVGWQGDLELTENPTEILMNSSKNVIALFETIPDNTGDSTDETPGEGPLIYLDSNGLTIRANSNAKPGDTAILNGIQYLIVDDELLREIIVDQREDLSTLVTTYVTDLSNMFRDKQTITPDIRGWDTSGVINMSYMFFNASVYNGDLKFWNTAKVTNMSYMFAQTNAFNQDIGNWNTANVVNMEGMFNNATAFNQDLSKWCVPLIANRPINFSTSSNLSENFIPEWGSCPE
ncbi:BspA family leucine-rich repeat surface protein [Gaetbulibacter aquiaggeris]|uniref:BspA family leucine-rich repeat surface protein n=1 Tax=Gaetbulibacter aquiaggeris TaxID=1735373 RepID=A0ABW7MSW4_9FLAO